MFLATVGDIKLSEDKVQDRRNPKYLQSSLDVLVVKGFDKSNVMLEILAFQIPKIDPPDQLLQVFLTKGSGIQGNMNFLQLRYSFVRKALEEASIQKTCKHFKEDYMESPFD